MERTAAGMESGATENHRTSLKGIKKRRDAGEEEL